MAKKIDNTVRKWKPQHSRRQLSVPLLQTVLISYDTALLNLSTF
jgi:hypothetical protein